MEEIADNRGYNRGYGATGYGGGYRNAHSSQYGGYNTLGGGYRGRQAEQALDPWMIDVLRRGSWLLSKLFREGKVWVLIELLDRLQTTEQFQRPAERRGIQDERERERDRRPFVMSGTSDDDRGNGEQGGSDALGNLIASIEQSRPPVATVAGDSRDDKKLDALLAAVQGLTNTVQHHVDNGSGRGGAGSKAVGSQQPAERTANRFAALAGQGDAHGDGAGPSQVTTAVDGEAANQPPVSEEAAIEILGKLPKELSTALGKMSGKLDVGRVSGLLDRLYPGAGNKRTLNEVYKIVSEEGATVPPRRGDLIMEITSKLLKLAAA